MIARVADVGEVMTAVPLARETILTGLALVAFAANSVLCRLALGQGAIDAGSFTAIRLVSGAVTLFLVTALLPGKVRSEARGNWISAMALFLYASAFSVAYVRLTTATGALLLFASVQATMVVSALWSGERPHRLEWLGLSTALLGLVYLVFPGLAAPSPLGCVFMTVAGVSWGVYSLRGRGTADPVAVTADNFLRSVPLVFGASLVVLRTIQISPKGVMLALASGALASGVGYVIWYAALQKLTATRAAAVQLSVPLLAAVGGGIFLSEEISIRLLISSVTILGGVGLVVLNRTA